MSDGGFDDEDDVPCEEVQINNAEWIVLEAGASNTHRNGVWQYAWFDAPTKSGQNSKLQLTIICINGERRVHTAAIKQDQKIVRFHTGADGYKMALELIAQRR
jgi:hypothetical protein